MDRGCTKDMKEIRRACWGADMGRKKEGGKANLPSRVNRPRVPDARLRGWPLVRRILVLMGVEGGGGGSFLLHSSFYWASFY